MKATKEKPAKGIQIPPMKFEAIKFKLVGTSPLVQRPLVVRRKKGTEFYISPEDWRGIPTYGIRTSLQGALRIEGFRFGSRKPHINVRPDGFDVVEGTPMVRITKGKPRDASGHGNKIPQSAWAVLNSGKLAGAIAYPAGWEARAVVEYDSEIFKAQEIITLMFTAGEQVGLGYLRPDAHRRRKAPPCFDFGTFEASVG